jgi:hypothetical protein
VRPYKVALIGDLTTLSAPAASVVLVPSFETILLPALGGVALGVLGVLAWQKWGPR